MMKNKILALLSVICIVSMGFVFSSCYKNHNHFYGEWKVSSEATCFEAEKQYRTCGCGEIETRIIGVPLEHVQSDWIVDLDSSCETTGIRHKECLLCETELATEIIVKKKHNMTDWAHISNPTCTDAEVLERHCTTCATQNETKEGTAALGHIESDWIIDKNSTCTRLGAKHKECIVCETELVTEIIAKKEHNMTVWAHVSNPTCTDAEVLERHCTTCVTQNETKEGTAALGHIESDWITCYDAHHMETGYEETYCNICKVSLDKRTKSYTITFNSNGGSYVAPITALYKKLITKPQNPTKAGYTFVGWYLDDGSFNNLFFPENSISIVKMPIGGAILYAKWIEEVDTTFVDNFVTYRNLGDGEYEIVSGLLTNVNTTKYNIVSIADNAFDKWYKGTEYEMFIPFVQFTVPANVKTIGDNAFNDAYILEIYFETNSKLETIGEYAFANNWLQNKVLRLPEGLKTIGNNAFETTSENSDIDIIYLPETMENLGTDVFKGQYLRKIISKTLKLENNDYYKKIIEECEFQGLTNGEFTQVKDMLFWKSNTEDFARLTYYNISGVYTQEISLINNDKKLCEVLIMPEFEYDYIIESYTFYNLSGIHGVIFADYSNIIKIESVAFGYLKDGYGKPITLGDIAQRNYTSYPNFLFSSYIDWNNIELGQDWLYLDEGTSKFSVYCTAAVMGTDVYKVKSFLEKLNNSLSIKKNNNCFGMTYETSISALIYSADYNFATTINQSPLLLQEFL